MTKKRWISLLVENEIGVLARISGLFSGKSYNLESLTVGATEDETVSRMTISLTSDEQTFEQIKKQLNRCVEVIKVIDLTDTVTHRKEIMYIKIWISSEQDMAMLSYIENFFQTKVVDFGAVSVLLESIQTEERNNSLIKILQSIITGHMEIVRGGSVAIESIGSLGQ